MTKWLMPDLLRRREELHPRKTFRRQRCPVRANGAPPIAGGAALVLLAALLTAAPLAIHASTASASSVPPAPPGWTTVFGDSFSGPAGSPVDSNWTYDIGTQYNGAGCTGNWGTGEVESNTSSTANVATDGSGHLNITPVTSNRGRTSPPLQTAAHNLAATPARQTAARSPTKQPT